VLTKAEVSKHATLGVVTERYQTGLKKEGDNINEEKNHAKGKSKGLKKGVKSYKKKTTSYYENKPEGKTSKDRRGNQAAIEVPKKGKEEQLSRPVGRGLVVRAFKDRERTAKNVSKKGH